jgi:hypothetical protein
MRKALIIVLIIVVVAGIALGLKSKTEKEAQNNSAPSVDTAHQADNQVDNNQNTYQIPFKVGQKFDDFTVVSIKPRAYTADYTVQFSGTTTVSGVFRESPLNGTNEDNPKTIAAFTVDPNDLEKIPASDENGASRNTFYFNYGTRPLIDIVKGIEYGKKKTITIANYSLYHIGSEGGNSADFVEISK